MQINRIVEYSGSKLWIFTEYSRIQNGSTALLFCIILLKTKDSVKNYSTFCEYSALKLWILSQSKSKNLVCKLHCNAFKKRINNPKNNSKKLLTEEFKILSEYSFILTILNNIQWIFSEKNIQDIQNKRIFRENFELFRIRLQFCNLAKLLKGDSVTKIILKNWEYSVLYLPIRTEYSFIHTD